MKTPSPWWWCQMKQTTFFMPDKQSPSLPDEVRTNDSTSLMMSEADSTSTYQTTNLCLPDKVSGHHLASLMMSEEQTSPPGWTVRWEKKHQKLFFTKLQHVGKIEIQTIIDFSSVCVCYLCQVWLPVWLLLFPAESLADWRWTWLKQQALSLWCHSTLLHHRFGGGLCSNLLSGRALTLFPRLLK